MARKLSVELGLDVTGYVDGTKQVQYETNKSEQSLKQYVEANGRLAKQLRNAKEEARNLAVQLNDLSDAERNSEYGQTIAENLEFAIEKAAELQDVMGDVSEEIKRRASDTQGWDALKDTFEISKSAAMTYAGALASVTGNAKSLQSVIGTLTMVEAGFNTVIKIGNALQRQSNIMVALRRSGVISLTQAQKISTLSTKAATVATKGLGMAMKALPFVGIAATVMELGSALIDFVRGANKATDETKKLDGQSKELENELSKEQSALQSISKQYDTEYASSLAKTLTSYTKLQIEYNKLRTEHEKNDWIKNNKTEFANLGLSINSIKDAENNLVNNTEDVKKSFLEKAMAAAEYNRLVALTTKLIEIQSDAEKNAYKPKVGETVQASDVERYGLTDADYKYTADGITKVYTAAGAAKVAIVAAAKSSASATAELNAEIDKSIEHLYKYTTVANNTINKVSDPKAALTYLQQLEANVKKYQTELENINPKVANANDLRDAARQNLEKAQKELKDYKLFIGVEVEKPKSYKQELEDQLKEAQVQLDVAIKANDEQGIETAKESIRGIQKSIDDYKLTAKIEVETVLTPKDIAKIDSEVKELIDSAKPKVDEWSDFSLLPETDRKRADELKSQYDAIVKAREEAIKKMNDIDADDHTIAAYQKALEELGIRLEKIKPQLEGLNVKNLNLEKAELSAEKLSKAFDVAGEALAGFSSVFSSLGELTEDKGIQTAGIIAQALATLALSFAKVMNSTKHWTEWLAFGITGTAALVSMSAQIKKLNSGGYANGGVIPGSSYHGDNLLINANSGERVLTAQQNRNFERLVNGMDFSMFGPQRIVVTGKVVGSDIYLSQKHYKTINHIK